jgi:hypothetical protein
VHNVDLVSASPLRILLLSSACVVGVGCGGEDNRPATWTYVSAAIIQPNCATGSCHSRGSAVAGLDLSTAESGWSDLLEQLLPMPPEAVIPRTMNGRKLVLPGNPEQSRVVNMLRAYGANRMPPDRPLAEADIRLVEEWILAGAQND